jgi:hypothetical protein
MSLPIGAPGAGSKVTCFTDRSAALAYKWSLANPTEGATMIWTSDTRWVLLYLFVITVLVLAWAYIPA